MSLPEPITRKEQYLAKAAGGEGEIPEPITREEMYLKEIADNSGSGVSSYEELTDKPSIGGTELSGDMSLSDIGVNVNSNEPLGLSVVDGVLRITYEE